MLAKILFVDDDENILRGFERNLRNRYQVVTASSAAKALQILKKDSSFALIVSDFRMAEMNGVEFFARTSIEFPDCVRILLTGEADTRAAAAAVNQGHIFRFLTKPCPALILEKSLAEAIKHHDLITAEKVLLERTLRSSMGVLTEILNLLQPVAFSRSNRIYRIVAEILSALHISNKWEFEVAAMLCHIGCITVPLEILGKVSKRLDLTDKERAVYESHPETGRQLLHKIPRLDLVANIIGSQNLPCKPIPAWQELDKADRLTFGCHLLKMAIDTEDGLSRSLNKADLLAELRSKHHHPALLKPIEDMNVDDAPSRPTTCSHLESGMVIAEDIIGENGMLLMAKGQWLSETHVQYLQRRYEYSGTDDTVKVKAPATNPLVSA